MLAKVLQCNSRLILQFHVNLGCPVHAEPYSISSVSYILFCSVIKDFFVLAVKLTGSCRSYPRPFW